MDATSASSLTRRRCATTFLALLLRDTVLWQKTGEMMRGVGAMPLLLLACALARGSGVSLPEARADALPAARATSLRGWNSYNGWGGAVNETVLLAVADFMQARATANQPGLSKAPAELARRARSAAVWF